jgi:hypothetical protein
MASFTSSKFIEPDGAPVGVTQKMKSSDLGPADLWDFGIFDYADLATTTTPITVPTGIVWTPITNDGAGANTYKNLPDTDVTDIWNTSTNVFDFSELSIGDMIDIRLDLEITTSGPNQEYGVVLELGQGVTPYRIPFAVNTNVKLAGTVSMNRYNGIYIGNALTKDNPGQFLVASNGAATVTVNGWYCKVVKKGR